jgi:DNA-binding MarR family transcriptional regulator
MPASHFEAERFRYFILAALRLGHRQMNEYLKTIRLTPSQSEVIRVLEERQPISLKELGSLLICETGSPSRLIERMAEEGLVDKAADPEDARYVLLRLTKKGAAKAQLIRRFEEQMYEDLERLFPDGELAAVGAALEKMLSRFPVAETLRSRRLIRDAE